MNKTGKNLTKFLHSVTSWSKELRSLFHIFSEQRSIYFVIFWWKQQGKSLNSSGCNVSRYVYWFLAAERVVLCNSAVLLSVYQSISLCTCPSTYLPICLFYVQDTYKEMYHMEDPREEFETVEKFPLPVTETLVVSPSIPGQSRSTGLSSQQGQPGHVLSSSRSGNCRTGW